MEYRVTLLGSEQNAPTDSEKSFTVGPDQSLLEAALFQDIALPYGCQSGGCGACRAKLVAGQIHYSYDPPALSEEEKAQGYILLCQAQPRSDLSLQVEERLSSQAIPVRNMPVRVEHKQPLCHDVMQLMLKLPKGEVFEFLPGQYVDFLLRDGRRRSFSIANGPATKGVIELHIRHVPNGDFSDFVFSSMQDRVILRVEGPLGGFYLRPQSDHPILMMAGGTGLAPIKSMLEYMLDQGMHRETHLFWGVRGQRDLYLHETLLEWSQSLPWFDYTPVLSEPASGQPDASSWQGETGYVHEVVARRFPNMQDYDVYMSGPPVMVQAGRDQFLAQGLPVEQLFYDSFDYAFQTWPQQEAPDKHKPGG